jgi:hypothetical protein
MVLAQMQGKKSDNIKWPILQFHLIPYHSKFIKFSLSICSKSRFYLYFDYLIEFMMPLHVHLNNYALNFVGS